MPCNKVVLKSIPDSSVFSCSSNSGKPMLPSISSINDNAMDIAMTPMVAGSFR
ncbi:hypothetical protein BMS3Bbin11_01475 [bacterium BMS3Bbin11]|nr:hypothetical protein BMS3Bbin11_01475 [bacterium BMS3Bbin11]